MSKDKLLSALKTSENENKTRAKIENKTRTKSENKTRTKEIIEEVKKSLHEFSKPEIEKIRKNEHKIGNKKSLSASKKTKKYIFKLEEKLSKLKTYHDYNATDYKGIKDVKDLFDLPTDEGY